MSKEWIFLVGDEVREEGVLRVRFLLRLKRRFREILKVNTVYSIVLVL